MKGPRTGSPSTMGESYAPAPACRAVQVPASATRAERPAQGVVRQVALRVAGDGAVGVQSHDQAPHPLDGPTEHVGERGGVVEGLAVASGPLPTGSKMASVVTSASISRGWLGGTRG